MLNEWILAGISTKVARMIKMIHADGYSILEAALLMLGPPTAAAYLAFRKSVEVSKKVEELHSLINSRFTALLDLTQKVSRQEGFMQGLRNSSRERSSTYREEQE